MIGLLESQSFSLVEFLYVLEGDVVTDAKSDGKIRSCARLDMKPKGQSGWVYQT